MSSPRSQGARRRAQFALFACALCFHSIDALAQSWVPVAPSGVAPAIRRQEGLIVDEVGNRMIVAGGENSDGRTWAMNLVGPPQWTDLGQPVPEEALDIVRAVYDSNRRRMLLVTPSLSVWALDLENPAGWSQLEVGGSSGPAPRRYPAVAYDSFRDRLVIFGGGPDTGLYQDVWALDLAGTPTWQQITPAGPGPAARWSAVAVYDAGGDQLVIGTGNTALGITLDFWALPLGNGTGWIALNTLGPIPLYRYLAAATYDPATRELLLFGGNTTGSDGAGLNDLWGLDLSNPVSWVAYSPPGPRPIARWSHMTVFHRASAQLYTYGGWDGDEYRGDVWAISRPNPDAPPVILGFTPRGGKAGDEIVINGSNVISPLEVTIGGAVAPILSSSFSSVRAVVPPGAITGPVTVTTVNGMATSEGEFFIGELPELTLASPDSGRWGEVVELRGRHLATASKVVFGGTGSASFVVSSDTVLLATVDTLATSGTIKVTTLVGTGESAFTFMVIPDDPRPRLLSVKDVAGDQGGCVMLRWRASDFDRPRYKTITGYRVWRRAPLGSSPGLGAAGKNSLELGLPSADPSIFWESLAEVPAAFLAGYAYTAPTLTDSSEFDNPYTAYFVQAFTASPFTFYNSSPDSGYSVDNFPPPAPSPLAVNYGPTANTLHWRGSALRDLRGYDLHRGTNADFVPMAGNRVVTVSDTSYVDISGNHFYKLAAVDIHGNRSRYVAVSPDRPVGTIASFFRSFRERGLARVVWHSGGNPNLFATVYRRTETSDWEPVGGLLADGRGYLTYEDRAVANGVRYGYRLGILEAGSSEALMAETWVEPFAEAFAFTSRIRNPSAGGRISCAFVVPVGERADVRLFDIGGRELERQSLQYESNGERTVEFGVARRLRAGVYLLRATSGRTVLTRRVVVLD